MKIYIAGKITGTDDFIERFGAAAKKIREKGHTPVSPISLQDILPQENTTHAQYMSACFGLMRACEGAYFLPDWQESKGARAERGAARLFGLLIFEEETGIPEGRAQA